MRALRYALAAVSLGLLAACGGGGGGGSSQSSGQNQNALPDRVVVFPLTN